MKALFVLVLILMSGSSVAQECRGNPASYCATQDSGRGCKMQFGSGSCVMKFHGGCNRFWNSGNTVPVYAPAKTVAEWYGFVSRSPAIRINRQAITCPF